MIIVTQVVFKKIILDKLYVHANPTSDDDGVLDSARGQLRSVPEMLGGEAGRRSLKSRAHFSVHWCQIT